MEPNLFVQIALNAWNTQISRTTNFFDAKSDEDLLNRIAPGKNSITYLLGHLIAVNDSMISLLGLGDRSYAHFDEIFIKNPYTSETGKHNAAALRIAWKKSNEELTAYFNKLSPEEWFARHTSMTDEDFAKDPSRNKLSVLLNRTSHVAYHLGQLILVK
jgi:uncharacterized damage-inducible protein DinB